MPEKKIEEHEHDWIAVESNHYDEETGKCYQIQRCKCGQERWVEVECG